MVGDGRRIVRRAAGLWVSPVAGLSVGNSYWPAADVFGGRERGTQTSRWPSVTGRLEEKEVVGQMGPVEAEGFDGSGDQLEGDGRSGPQEAPQWAANCGRITPGEWRPTVAPPAGHCARHPRAGPPSHRSLPPRLAPSDQPLPSPRGGPRLTAS